MIPSWGAAGYMVPEAPPGYMVPEAPPGYMVPKVPRHGVTGLGSG
jgi:hypothetical protein